ncbi:type VII secretion system-associated protein [Streptomyces sp. NPDC048663]|uniref:type VII secretion system-associated protein n=1 Tax=Streptomyces sp. NPDC048663 TaxID=3155638 RepID=UPI00341321EB
MNSESNGEDAAGRQAEPVIPTVPVAEQATAPSEAGTGQAVLPTQEQAGSLDSDIPPVPDHIREAARQAPDHWLGLIDPTWSGEGTPPNWALVGQWRSDLDGEIVEWLDNEEYQPSPKAMGWPDPTDPVDDAVQLAATGYGLAETVTHTLATAEVAVFLAPGGGLLSAVAPDDETPIVPVFTSPDHLHSAGRLSFRPMNIPELLDQLPEGHLIYLNPSGPVSMTVETGPLREAVEAAARMEGENSWYGSLDGLLNGAPDSTVTPDASAGASTKEPQKTPAGTVGDATTLDTGGLL